MGPAQGVPRVKHQRPEAGLHLRRRQRYRSGAQRPGKPEERPRPADHDGERRALHGRSSRRLPVLRRIPHYTRQRRDGNACESDAQGGRRPDADRRRDCGYHRVHRGFLHRREGNDRHRGTGTVPHGRGPWPGDHGGDPHGCRGRPARRTEHRHAHQDRTVGPESGHLRSPRRSAAHRDRGDQYRGLFLHGGQGLQSRRKIPDAGHHAQRPASLAACAGHVPSRSQPDRDRRAETARSKRQCFSPGIRPVRDDRRLRFPHAVAGPPRTALRGDGPGARRARTYRLLAGSPYPDD